jgi:branched-chain amino acid transport system substrate-binding protein
MAIDCGGEAPEHFRDLSLAYPLLHVTVAAAPKSSAGGVQQEQEMGKRRTIALASVTCVALACVPLAWATPARADDKPPLKVGVLEDHSGDIAIFTMPKVHGAHLAVDEINAAGGILGRKVEIVEYDPQFDNAKFQEFARRLIEKDKVEVIFGAATSASREAIRPIIDKDNALLFYAQQYEGGVCDGNVIGTGGVPEQQFSTLIPYMMEKYGKKVYIIAADYNFGQISTEWTKKLVTDAGGQIVGTELIPLGVSQFGQTIQNIQKAKPDWLMSLVVGNSQSAFYEQAASAGLHIPMGSSITIGLGFEHKRFKPPTMEGMHVAINWFEEIDRPAAKDFVKRWHAKYPDEFYINDMGENEYAAVYMYKKLVEMAGSTDIAKIRQQIATGNACIDAPEGKICIDPKSQHASHQMTLLSVAADHSVHVEKTWDRVDPYWLGQIGCDLTKDDPKDQYTPSYLPNK